MKNAALKNILSPIEKNLFEVNEKLSEDFSMQNVLINKIANYAINSGGKRLRPALVFLFAKMIGEIKPEHLELACAVELIHNATLIHDDIIDEAAKRHNQKTINTKWDSKTAVLAGDYLLALALKHLIKAENNDLLELFAKITQEICNGEIEQMTNKKDSSIESYINKVKRKTGMLFKLCTQGACLLSGAKNLDAAENYALNLGIAFQAADDLLIFKNNYDDKSLKTDFENEIHTLPLIIGAKEGIEIDFTKNFEKLKKQILATNTIDKSYQFALNYSEEAIKNIEEFPKNEYRDSLCNLAKYIVEREF